MILVNNKPLSLPTGQGSVGNDINVPDDLTNTIITLGLCTTATPTFWPRATTILTANAYWSVDGGANFRHRSVFSVEGGIHLSKGVEVPNCVWSFGLPPSPGRLLRILFDVIDGPLDTRVTVEVS